MEKNKKNTLIIAYFVSILFIAEGISGINKGIQNHQLWRVLLASVGVGGFVFLAFISVVYFFKKDK